MAANNNSKPATVSAAPLQLSSSVPENVAIGQLIGLLKDGAVAGSKALPSLMPKPEGPAPEAPAAKVAPAKPAVAAAAVPPFMNPNMSAPRPKETGEN